MLVCGHRQRASGFETTGFISGRDYRTLANMVWCILKDSGLPRSMREELFITAAFLANRLPHWALGSHTPYFKECRQPGRYEHYLAHWSQPFVYVRPLLRIGAFGGVRPVSKFIAFSMHLRSASWRKATSRLSKLRPRMYEQAMDKVTGDDDMLEPLIVAFVISILI